MKHTRVIIAILLILLAWFGSGCKTAKKLQKQKASYEQSQATLRDSIRKVSATKDSLHEKEVQTLKAAGVKFRDRPFPVPIYYPDSVGRDSLLKVIAVQNGLLISSHNEIEILSDGTIKARGDIAEAHSTVEQKDKEIYRLKQKYDSLIQIKVKDTTGVKIEQSSASSSKKTSTFDWLRWVFFLLGIGVGIFIKHHWKRILSLFKIVNMKILFLFLVSSVMLLASCSSKPDNIVHKVTEKPAGWQINDDGTANEQVFEQFYTIQPTWGQSCIYAAGYGWWIFIGFVLLVASAWVVLTSTWDVPIVANWDPALKYRIPIMLLLLAFSFACFLTPPGVVKRNNAKPIPKQQYDYYMQRDGNIRAVWDSLEAGGHIIGGKRK